MAKNRKLQGFAFQHEKYPDDNVKQLCEVFRVTSQWRKYVDISHYKSP